jgi:diketogulonate reductase-like aldo/keto reductase
VIGLGTWQTFDVGRSERDRAPLREVLAEFVRLGGRLVDSSPMYGRSEEVIGDLATELGIREQLFIATKVWTNGREAGIRQMEESERKLRGRIDLMQVHNLVDVDTHLATLREWKAAGRIGAIGITHYHAGAHLDLARVLARGGIDFVQLNYSVAEREAERRILPYAAERGVKVIVNRPFGEGSVLRRVKNRPVPDGFASWAEALLSFVISHPAVTYAIPATSSVEHLRQNMRARVVDEETRKRIAAGV